MMLQHQALAEEEAARERERELAEMAARERERELAELAAQQERERQLAEQQRALEDALARQRELEEQLTAQQQQPVEYHDALAQQPWVVIQCGMVWTAHIHEWFILKTRT